MDASVRPVRSMTGSPQIVEGNFRAVIICPDSSMVSSDILNGSPKWVTGIFRIIGLNRID